MGTTADKLRNIAEAKADIGAALAERGVAVPERLSEYGQAVRRVGEVTITYLDWDDTILGTQAVPKGVDIRRQVNDYVREHFIHPDIRAVSDPLSIARTDNYRGGYPHMGPRPEGTTEGTVKDGGSYPLTYKLDYAFFKRPVVKVMEAQEDGTQVWKGAYASRTDENGKPVADVAHPFAYGWAVVDPAVPEETWTVMGAGWLSGYALSADGVATFTHRKLEEKFLFADFESGIAGDMVVKAVYDEGFDLLNSTFNYTLKDLYPAKKISYGSTMATLYSLQLEYSRAYTSRDGVCCGIAIARGPKARIKEHYDVRPLGVTAEEQAQYRQGDQIVQKNDGDVSVTIDLDPKQAKIDVMLAERVDESPILSAASRSLDLSYILPGWPLRNFTYLDSADPVGNCRGADGYILRCTLQDWAYRAKTYIAGAGNKFLQHCNVDTATDLGLRHTDGSVYTVSTFFSSGEDAILEAYRLAYDRGWLDKWGDPYLTTHQLQHYICTQELLTAEEAEEKTFWWCKLHDHCLFAGILEYAHRANAGDETAVNNISSCGMRMDLKGTAVTDILAFAAKVVEVVRLAGEDYASLTKDQVQYYVIHGGNAVPDVATAAAESEEKYWWFDGGETALPTTLEKTLAAAVLAAEGRPALLNQLEPAFDAAVAGNESQWRSATYDLRADEMGGLFSSFAAFKSSLIAAVTALGGDAIWEQCQYHIIYGETLDADAAYEYAEDHFWWYRDGVYITDQDSLLEAARLSNVYNRLAPLASLTHARLYNDDAPNAYNKFAKVIDGTPFAPEEMAEMRGLLRRVHQRYSAALSAALSRCWNFIQYFFLHSDVGSVGPSDVEREGASYYWWHNDVPQTVFTVGTSDCLNGGLGRFSSAELAALMEEAYRARVNRNPKAWVGLTEEIAGGFRFVSGADGASYQELPRFSLVELKEKLEDLCVQAGKSYASLTWLQIQHHLLTGAYLEKTHEDLPTVITYWWYYKDGRDAQELPLFYVALDGYTAETTSKEELTDTFDLYCGPAMLYCHKTKSYLNGAVSLRKAARNRLLKMADGIKAEGIVAADAVDWFVLQYYSLVGYSATNGFVSKVDAYLYYRDTLGAAWPYPDYVTPPIITYSDMLKAAWQAYGVTPENPSALDGLTDLDMVNGVTGTPDPNKFFLRKDDAGTLFSTLDEVKGALKTAVDAIQHLGQSRVESLDWIELQHLMLGNSYRTKEQLRGDNKIDYWWELGDEKQEVINADAEVMKLTVLASQNIWWGEGPTSSDLDAALLPVIDALKLQDASGNTYTAAGSPGVVDLRTQIEGLVDADMNDSMILDLGSGYAEATWYQLQHYIVTGAVQYEADIPTGNYTWKPGASRSFVSLLSGVSGEPTTTEEIAPTITETDPDTGA